MNYREEKSLEQFIEDMSKGYRLTEEVKERLKYTINQHVNAMVERMFMTTDAEVKIMKLKDGKLNVISTLEIDSETSSDKRSK